MKYNLRDMNNCYHLLLDDERTAKDVFDYKRNPIYVEQAWTIVRSYSEFIDKVAERYSEGCLPSYISFDHDLTKEHYLIGGLSGFKTFDETSVKTPTGWHCLNWYLKLCETNDLVLPNLLFHSKNTGGVQNMLALLDEYKFNKHKEGLV